GVVGGARRIRRGQQKTVARIVRVASWIGEWLARIGAVPVEQDDGSYRNLAAGMLVGGERVHQALGQLEGQEDVVGGVAAVAVDVAPRSRLRRRLLRSSA